MSLPSIEIHTAIKGVVTEPLIDTKGPLFSARSKLFSIKSPNDFSGTYLITQAQNLIGNTLNILDDAISQINSCISDMEHAEQEAMYQIYKNNYLLITRDVSKDIGGYDKKDEINQHDVLMDVIEIVGIDTWATLSEKTRKILLNAEYIHKYMENNDYTYCVLENARGDEYDTEIREHRHGLNNDFQDSKSEYDKNGNINKGFRNTCCATFVSWVLQDAGVLDKEKHQNGADELQTVLQNEKDWQVVNDEKDLKPGDILGYNHHVEIFLGYDEDNNKILYNAGSGQWIREGGPDTREDLTGSNKEFEIAYRYIGDEKENNNK